MEDQAAGNVLIVEDDDDVRWLVELVLRRAGLLTASVSGGLSALSSIRQQLPRLVLLDVEMPGVDGLEVCRRLKSDATTCDAPVLIMSGNTTKADVDAGYAAGCDDYLTKPFSPAELVRRVVRLLPKIA